MRKIFISTLVIFISVFSVESQLLWQISGNGLKHKSYLFATHHLIPISFLDSIPGLYPAFNSSDMVVSEIVLNESELSMKLMQAAMLADTVLLSKLLLPEAYELVDNELINTINLSLKNVDRLHPAMVQLIYHAAICRKIEHSDNTNSDSYFQLVASKKNIPVVGLETVEQQINNLLPEDNLQKQVNDLVEIIKRKDDYIRGQKEINRLYRNSDLSGLYELYLILNSTWDISEEENARILDNRNIDWVAQLPHFLENNRCFIAVGALHLPGEKGLINLLRKAGYKVKPVSR